MDRSTIEYALDNGRLWGAMANGRFWRLRRNGRTQTWKRNPQRFSIPVKAGLRSCARITETSNVGSEIGADFVIDDMNPADRKRWREGLGDMHPSFGGRR